MSRVETAEVEDRRILDLDADAEPRTEIKLDGRVYLLRAADDLTMAQKEHARVLLARQRELLRDSLDVTDEGEIAAQGAVLDHIESQLVRIAVEGLPGDAVLNPRQRNRIIDAFFDGLDDALLPLVLRLIQTVNRQLTATSGTSQPESSEPTESASSPSSTPVAAD
jgi:hypothetical protein